MKRIEESEIISARTLKHLLQLIEKEIFTILSVKGKFKWKENIPHICKKSIELIKEDMRNCLSNRERVRSVSLYIEDIGSEYRIVIIWWIENILSYINTLEELYQQQVASSSLKSKLKSGKCFAFLYFEKEKSNYSSRPLREPILIQNLRYHLLSPSKEERMNYPLRRLLEDLLGTEKIKPYPDVLTQILKFRKFIDIMKKIFGPNFDVGEARDVYNNSNVEISENLDCVVIILHMSWNACIITPKTFITVDNLNYKLYSFLLNSIPKAKTSQDLKKIISVLHMLVDSRRISEGRPSIAAFLEFAKKK